MGNKSYEQLEAAFPRESYSAAARGMSLRDYFAGQALVGMQAHPANERPKSVASWAYEVADAMLAVRDAEAREIA